MAIRKLCYVVVADDEDGSQKGGNSHRNTSFWYTQSALQNVLQLVGCKVHHALKISRRVFDVLERENLQGAVCSIWKGTPFGNRVGNADTGDVETITKVGSQILEEEGTDHSAKMKSREFDFYKDQVTVTVSRTRFVDAICASLEKYHYVGPSQRDDIFLACRIRERKESVTILLCGTSGCGKSTLSSLLASRLGITTIISTDSVRHMMRSFVDEKENPLLWASTYHAGEFLDAAALAEAKARKKDKNLSSSHAYGRHSSEEVLIPNLKDNSPQSGWLEETPDYKHDNEVCVSDKSHSRSHLTTEHIGSKVLAIEGYKAQSEMVIDRLDSLISTWEERKESAVVEGVHLSLNFVMGLMKKHPSIIPFLIYISSEEKHLERFAVRAKYMTLDPSKNKYVKYIRNIRTIQDYLCKRAEKHLVPKVNNTNVDRSVASIHSTIFSCLRKRQTGIPLYDIASNTVKVIDEEYSKQSDSNHIGSKGMFRIIQRQGSLRKYMAIVNDDGFVTKAWPFSSTDNVGEANALKDKNMIVGRPVYGPLHISEVEPVNVQFGNFGIGSWPNDIEGTSYARSSNSSRADLDEETSKYSSSASSPLHPNGHAKESIEEPAVSESEEEQFDDEEKNSSDSAQEFDDDDEIGGSIVESPTRSDEEFEDDEDERINTSSQKLGGHMLSKHLRRALSITPSGKIVPEGKQRFSRFRSLPLLRSRSRKNKVMGLMATPEGPSDAQGVN